MSTSLTLTEYEFLQCKYEQDAHYISPAAFKQIELFILQNQDTAKFLKIASKRNFGKVLQAQNFVGLIQTLDGTTIEILPKIHRAKDAPQSRDIVIKMLRTLRRSPFKTSNFAHLQYTHMPLLEIFITMFLEELGVLIRKGMYAHYQRIENNHSPFLKGKLSIQRQIKYNNVNAAAYFAVVYDEFTYDILPNQLIKTTLQFLYKKSHWTVNQQEIRRCLFICDEISTCNNYRDGFSRLTLDRTYAHYENTITWCKVFLLGSSFSPYKGSTVAWALLFDMNMLFESYVAHCIKKKYPNLSIKTQHGKHCLAYQKGGECFMLKPDIVINDGRIIIDTKWKLLESSGDISQSDVYQMYAYATKYQDNGGKVQVYLVYPKTGVGHIEGYTFNKDSTDLTLDIDFFDLEGSEEQSIYKVLEAHLKQN